MTLGLAAFSAVLHVYIFFMESILWGTPAVNKKFGVTADNAEVTRLFAFNQGFYNLFLAIAIVAGLVMVHSLGRPQGQLLVDYAMLSIFGAGIVLVSSNSNLIIPAMAQALPPVIYGIFRFIEMNRSTT